VQQQHQGTDTLNQTSGTIIKWELPLITRPSTNSTSVNTMVSSLIIIITVALRYKSMLSHHRRKPISILHFDLRNHFFRILLFCKFGGGERKSVYILRATFWMDFFWGGAETFNFLSCLVILHGPNFIIFIISLSSCYSAQYCI
jgi:hypothetical protein